MLNETTVATSLETQFVDLALKYRQWDEIESLPDSEMQIFLDVISAAGFEFEAIKLGKLTGRCRDRGRIVDEYLVNRLCPFKVVDEDNRDNHPATGWLDHILRCVVYGTECQNEEHDSIATVVSRQIKNSRPLEPIQITMSGNLLVEIPTHPLSFSFDHFVEHTRDGDILAGRIGVHKFCGGVMERKMATNIYDVIICHMCNLRVLFPRSAITYGDLRKALSKRIDALSAL